MGRKHAITDVEEALCTTFYTELWLLLSPFQNLHFEQFIPLSHVLLLTFQQLNVELSSPDDSDESFSRAQCGALLGNNNWL